MRLGFDLDGTLADMQAALAREATGLFPDIDPASLPRSTAPDEAPVKDAGTHSLSSRQQRELWKAVCARVNFWETLDEIEPGVLARLFRLMQERRWEIIFL